MFQNVLCSEIDRQFPISKTGRPRKLCTREAVRCVFLLLRTGMQWRELQPKNASYVTVAQTMHKWIGKGIFEDAYKKVLKLYMKHHPAKYYCIDSSYVKNAFGRDVVGRNPVDRGRKATKVSVITDQNGIVHACHLAAGNIPDVKLLQSTLATMLTKLEHLELLSDKGYDSKRKRVVCNDYGLKDRIARRKCKTGRRMNSKRVVVENVFAWLDKYRRLLYRYEVKSTTYLAFSFFALGNLLSNGFSKRHVSTSTRL